ncbi:hypothetical protein K2173_005763 [Erythroxylum novogranatense]|uniref:D-cysteine desulfhydrase n=1 Tax=Erythroxylum novogranatense TaxID=1862640 RepID=A0AAV8U2L2_9ROSI|nr:hypothetical protein K2173_005763 [Erythroxylum novogranatense]
MIGRVTVTAVEGGLPFRQLTCQQFSKVALRNEGLISTLLRRKWMLHAPDAKINQIVLSPIQGRQRNGMCNNFSFLNNTDPYLGCGVTEKDSQEPSFYVVRDDLVHPLVNGNKARKLDGLLPLLVDQSVTDVVTCGGCQSAHAAAIAVSCAERGLRSHLLLRGERPEIMTGYNLISTIHGHVTYVPRSVYAHREHMLKKHANLVAGLNGHVVSCNDVLEASFSNQSPSPSNFGQMGPHDTDDNCPRKVAIVNEGAGDAVALLGCIRLVEYLSQEHILGKERYIKLVVDAGTGTTAIGLGLGVHCLGLPWEVSAVMLADTIKAYVQQEKYLISDFQTWLGFHLIDHTLHEVEGGIVNWVERNHKRKFGNVLEGEIEACQKIAQQTGILVDPMYTLAAWEMATQLCKEERVKGGQVVMLHTGGTLGMFGLAQRYKSIFSKLKDG